MQSLTIAEIEEVSGGGSIVKDVAVAIASTALYEAAKAAITSQLQGGGDLQAATAGQLGA